ncbi:MAG: FHA domain-containing protein [Planctomycetes bacterium]|nr:FHA domain-containing protein [Planctomycetota bacterium]
MSTFFLLVRDEGREPKGRTQALAGMSIGRAPENQCVLQDPNVGRRAARLVEDRGVWYVEDLGSTNRTSIRGVRKLQKGEREALRHGLVIELGRSSIEIVEEGADEEATDARDATKPESGEGTLVAGAMDSEMRTLQAPKPVPAAAPRTGATPPGPGRPPTASPAFAQDAALEDGGATLHAPQIHAPVPAAVPAQEPAPELAPKPEPESPPRRPASESPSPSPAAVPPRAEPNWGTDSIGSGTQSMRPVTGEFVAIAAMHSRRPRLVLVNEAFRRVEFLSKGVMVIGREQADCVIDHKAISQPHAEIRFVEATNSFQIEDRKSKNQTFVGTVALNPGTPHPLAPECLVRFGPIEAVFVIDLDSDNVKIPPAWYAGAVRALLVQHQVTAEQAKAAEEEALKGERHVGEALMLSGAVSARTWARAFEMGKLAPPPSAERGGKRGLIVALVVVIVLAVLAFVFQGRLGL